MTVNVPPEFIDNLDGNTLAEALRFLLGGRDGETATSNGAPVSVRIATAYFNPGGFAQIADRLSRIPTVRLLLGADPAAGPEAGRRDINVPAAEFEARRVQDGLRRMDTTLHRERDVMPFTRASADSLLKLIEALKSGNVEVRRYEKSFLHAKAYIVSPARGHAGRPEGVIAGSSNLTGAGLTRNLELNLGRYDHAIAERATGWFDELWDAAVPYDLAAVYDASLALRSPWDVFIHVLWRLYGDEIENEAGIDGGLPLTTFQKHGAARAMRLIQEIGGVMVADEVGLGKTFIAGEILKKYTERRQRALLICPAAVRDSTWKRFISDHQLHIECLSYEQLARDRQLHDARRPNADKTHLLRDKEEYQLVIVDEAHNYRNPDAPTRAAALRTLLLGPRRDLLLLTATPVNNSLWDLYNLTRFFLRQDARLANRGILSIRERFEMAMRTDPSNLNPDILFPIIGATTVKRTRQFVKKHYPDDTITDPDGRTVPIIFPKPEAISVRYSLDSLLPGFFDDLESALEPDGPDAIRFARYMPDGFLLGVGDDIDCMENARARAFVGLLRSGLLKRFESSVFAFRKTVEKIAGEHGKFLDALDAGHVVTTEFLREVSDDDDELEDLLDASHHKTDATLYDVDALRSAVERDRDLLLNLADQAGRIEPEQDPKLHALVDELGKIAGKAKEEAKDAKDERQKRKVLVFSFFADTVEWIIKHLRSVAAENSKISVYHGRMESTSGSGSWESKVFGFAPVSMGAPGNQDLYDLIVTTDVLAEGVNLQQCRNIINFDVPWNPMRLVQRQGRIDRINSSHNRVFLRTIFPADRLDRMLNLEQRILNKLAMAAASIGVMTSVSGAARGPQVFSETREEIEKLLAEDPSLFERGGTVSAAQSGEEYRLTLRKALESRRKEIVSLPRKSGSGMIRGSRRGVFFCAVVGDESNLRRIYLRFVDADENWTPASCTGEMEREVGACLRMIECADEDVPVWRSDALDERIYDFWEAARQDIRSSWMDETDPAKLQPRVRPLNHRVAEFIRANQAGLSKERTEQALDILESPWPRREENMLRDWFASENFPNNISRSNSLIGKIIDSGLEPALPPQPLPPIGLDDVELVCWMGIEPETPSRRPPPEAAPRS